MNEWVRQLETIKFDRTTLRLDDLTFAALDKSGRIAGMVRGELELQENGKLRLALQRYRSTRF